MSGELETGALASVGGLSKPKGDLKKEPEACRNCGTLVDARYCGECGQLAQNFHRPIWGLASEMLGDFLSLDGRVMRTLPSLMWRPGRATREYLDGKRQQFVPPFRLYLLTSFIFFLMLFAFGDSQHWFDTRYAVPDAEAPDSVRMLGEDGRAAGPPLKLMLDMEAAEQALAEEGITPNDATDPEGATESEEESIPWLREDGRVNRAVIEQYDCEDGQDLDCEFLKRMGHRVADAYENQGMFFASIQSWAPRLALAFTPAMILLLVLVYPFRRSIYVYDHIITALHVQSWIYLLLSIGLVFFWLGQSWFAVVLLLAPPVYLYRTFRVVYGSGRIFSVVRTLFILFSLNIVFSFLVFALAVLGIADTAPVVGSN